MRTSITPIASILALGLVATVPLVRGTPACCQPAGSPVRPSATPAGYYSPVDDYVSPLFEPLVPSAHSSARPFSAAALKEKLKLSDSQFQQIRTIIAKAKAQVGTWRSDASLSDAAKKERIEGLRQSAYVQARAVLTPEQLKIFDALPLPRAATLPARSDSSTKPGSCR